MKPDNLGGIYVVLVSISSVSFILLPVGLELGVEITHNAETSTAILWSGGNLVSVLWVLGANSILPLGRPLSVIDGFSLPSSDERPPRWSGRKPTTKHEASSHFQRSIYYWDDVDYHSIYGRADKTKDGRAEGEGRLCYTDGGCTDVKNRSAEVYE